jgi:hypothetical protein
VSLDRCGENVPVVGVGQVDDLDERLVVHDQHIPDRLVHQFPGAVQLDRVQVGTIALEVAKGLVEDPVRPLRLDEASLGDADQQVAQTAGTEDIGVVDDDERHVSTDPSPG